MQPKPIDRPETQGYFGVVDSNGAVNGRPWSATDADNGINHTTIFGPGAGIRWRASRRDTGWYGEPTEEEMDAVDNWLTRKGFPPSRHVMFGTSFGLREAAHNPNADLPFKDRLGRCYELAGRYATSNPEGTLVHGSIEGFGKPRLEHAWVDQGETVWEPTSGKEWPAGVFDQLFNPQEDVRFSHEDVLKNTLRFRHWGPWAELEEEKRRAQARFEPKFPVGTKVRYKGAPHMSESYIANIQFVGTVREVFPSVTPGDQDIYMRLDSSHFPPGMGSETLFAGKLFVEEQPWTWKGKRDGQAAPRFPIGAKVHYIGEATPAVPIYGSTGVVTLHQEPARTASGTWNYCVDFDSVPSVWCTESELEPVAAWKHKGARKTAGNTRSNLTTVRFGDQDVKVETLKTAKAQALGFQHQDIPLDRGLLFPNCGEHSFHMYNVRSALLLIALDDQHRVVGKEIRQPETPGRPVARGAGQHILEVHPCYDEWVVVGQSLQRPEHEKLQETRDAIQKLQGQQAEEPERCHDCGAYRKPEEQGSMQQVTTDQGDAENGPDPDMEIYDTWHCDDCTTPKYQVGQKVRYVGPRSRVVNPPMAARIPSRGCAGVVLEVERTVANPVTRSTWSYKVNFDDKGVVFPRWTRQIELEPATGWKWRGAQQERFTARLDNQYLKVPRGERHPYGVPEEQATWFDSRSDAQRAATGAGWPSAHIEPVRRRAAQEASPGSLALIEHREGQSDWGWRTRPTPFIVGDQVELPEKLHYEPGTVGTVSRVHHVGAAGRSVMYEIDLPNRPLHKPMLYASELKRVGIRLAQRELTPLQPGVAEKLAAVIDQDRLDAEHEQGSENPPELPFLGLFVEAAKEIREKAQTEQDVQEILSRLGLYSTPQAIGELLKLNSAWAWKGALSNRQASDTPYGAWIDPHGKTTTVGPFQHTPVALTKLGAKGADQDAVYEDMERRGYVRVAKIADDYSYYASGKTTQAQMRALKHFAEDHAARVVGDVRELYDYRRELFGQYGWRKEPDASLIEDPTDHAQLTFAEVQQRLQDLEKQWFEIQSEVRERWPGWRLCDHGVLSPDNKQMGLAQAMEPEPYGRNMDPEIAEWSRRADALYDHRFGLQVAYERWERKPIEWPEEVRDVQEEPEEP